MKKYLIKIVLFFAVIAVIDLTFGKVCDFLRDHTKGGITGNIQYICKECDEDIIMLGSSRMRHHYVPQVLEDQLRLSCYNAGIDGNGIITAYGFLEMILNRYTPKLVIYDVNKSFDIVDGDNSKYLELLRPYFNDHKVADICKEVSFTEQWKLNSSLYRYNSKLWGLIGDFFHPIYKLDRGYWPLNKVMDYNPQLPIEGNEYVNDTLKIKYVYYLIDQTKNHNVRIVFVASPTWFGRLKCDDNDVIKEICQEKGIPFLDHYYDEKICSSKEYWSDATHMNYQGALLFSQMIANEILVTFPDLAVEDVLNNE